MSSHSSSLLDEIQLREASLRDARYEFEQGELTAQQFAELEQRELAAISQCQQRLDELGNQPLAETVAETPRAARRHRRSLLVVALGCFAAVAIVLVVNAISPRQPGSSETGGVNSTQAQRIASLLRSAEIDQVVGRTQSALAAYNQVLAVAPLNVEALTQSGWLYFSAGSAASNLSVIRLGEQRVSQAVAHYPRDPDPRLYYAIIAASTPGHRALAVRQFRKFLTLHPTAAELAIAHSWLTKLKIR